MAVTLKGIFDGKEKSSRILIEDSVAQNGRSLLKAFLCQLPSRCDSIHVVLNELNQEQFQRGLPPDVITKLKFHDCSCDPLGWDESTKATLDTDLCQHILSSIPSSHSKVVVVIDALSALIMHRSLAYTCRTLHRMTNHDHAADLDLSVIGLVHGDLHDDSSLTLLHHCATSVIKVEPPKQPEFTCLCAVLHKKLSGKVINTRTHVSLRNDFSIENITDYKPLVAAQDQSSAPDPAANLTFNLTLSDKEKEARSNLILPYMHHRQDPAPSLTMGSGKIFYQPDDADDFDEEDPDDDLDI